MSRADDDAGKQLSLFDDAPPEREAREPRARPASWDNIPDVRDGLTRVERVILLCLQQAQAEKHDRMVSTAMLYGRVVEHVDISVPEFQRILQRLVGVR